MDEIIKGLNPIISKIGDFFDLFDLSFVISGAITTLAFVFLFYEANMFKVDLSEIQIVPIFLSVIICYVVGIASWVLGKAIRNIFGPNYLKISDSFKRNQATELPLYVKYKSMISDEYDENNAMSELYGYLWVEIRENPKVNTSFSLIKRYWVQTATFDGLIISFLSWAIVFLLLTFRYKEIEDIFIGVGGAVVFLVVSIFTLLEAKRYKTYQMGEIVHTYVKMKSEII